MRKWGHYDSELPVFVFGFKIPGRITSSAANGTYVLRIKNVDLTAGLGTGLNQGERVTSADFSVFSTQCPLGQATPLSYWCDFDSNGTVTSADFQIISSHSEDHNCLAPNNP